MPANETAETMTYYLVKHATLVEASIYTFLLILAILGNATMIGVIGKNAIVDRGGARMSDIIIINMTLSNLLVSLMRNSMLALSDLGYQVCSV